MRRSHPVCCAIWAIAVGSGGLLAADDLRPAWGIYQIHWQDEQFRAGLDDQLKTLGGHPSYVLDFRDLNPRRG